MDIQDPFRDDVAYLEQATLVSDEYTQRWRIGGEIDVGYSQLSP